MLTLSQVARILVQHGINGVFADSRDAEDFAAFVAAHVTAQGCKTSALRLWLGY